MEKTPSTKELSVLLEDLQDIVSQLLSVDSISEAHKIEILNEAFLILSEGKNGSSS